MTDATLENPEETEKKNAESTENKEFTDEQKLDYDMAIAAIANQFLDKTNLAEAFSTVPLSTLIQSVQSQAVTQAKETIKQMPAEDYNGLVNDLKNQSENQESEKTE